MNKISEILCNICDKRFSLNSEQQAKDFCSHVAQCPTKTESAHRPRFTCSICKNTVHLKKSFQAHVIRDHLSKPVNISDKKKRETRK